MTEESREGGRKVPLSLRRRASLLYKGRRSRILREPVAVLKAAGLEVQESPDARFARASDGDLLIEVAFAGRARLFGVFIDTVWVGRSGEMAPLVGEVAYRFDRHGFHSKQTGLAGLVDRLNGAPGLREEIERAEVKTLRIKEAPAGRQVELTPQPGTITAVYLPPMPPFTVPFRPEESRAHLALVRRILKDI